MSINNILLKIGIPLVGLAVGAVVLLITFFILQSWWSSPPSVLGFSILGLDKGPEQPIAFPHTVHVQQVGLDCQFCHRTASTQEAAGIPAVEQCMFCHELGKIDGSEFDSQGQKVPGTASPEIVKLQTAFYGEELVARFHGIETNGDTPEAPQPINWVRVHRLPDHVQFIHEPHLSLFTDPEGTSAVQLEVRERADRENITLVEAACTVCHGEVREMLRVEQERNLKMRDCVDCHRNNNAPTDCVACHY